MRILTILFLFALAFVTVYANWKLDGGYKGSHRRRKNSGQQTDKQVRKRVTSVPLNFTTAEDAAEPGIDWGSGRSEEGIEQMYIPEQDRTEQDGDTQWMK